MSEQEREVTNEAIARRAHEIAESGEGGSDDDNWHRAERELRGTDAGGEGQGPWAKIGSGDADNLTDDS
jgi:hypothetical protein